MLGCGQQVLERIGRTLEQLSPSANPSGWDASSSVTRVTDSFV
jgi:hypothetical protein